MQAPKARANFFGYANWLMNCRHVSDIEGKKL